MSEGLANLQSAPIEAPVQFRPAPPKLLPDKSLENNALGNEVTAEAKKSAHIFVARPLRLTESRMGRPKEGPKLQAVPRKTGGQVFRVRFRLNGKDVRRNFETIDSAKLFASQIEAEQSVERIHVLPTRFSPEDLKQAEAAKIILDSLGVSLVEAAKYVVRYYQKPSTAKWETAIADYERERLRLGRTAAQVSNVSKAAKRLAAFSNHPEVSLTESEFRDFLEKETEGMSPTSYNGLLGDARTFVRWLVKHKILPEDPTQGFERIKIGERGRQVLRPQDAEALLRRIEKEHTAWVPYVAYCMFAGLRPGIREGEAGRLHEDLRAGREVCHANGFDVRGKANGLRLVPWALTGPLRQWLEKYPADKGLWPCDTATQAEREWFRIRGALPADVLRHTALSAMAYAPGASLAQVALAAGNSEAKLRKHYVGRWTPEDTKSLWAILPSI